MKLKITETAKKLNIWAMETKQYYCKTQNLLQKKQNCIQLLFRV